MAEWHSILILFSGVFTLTSGQGVHIQLRRISLRISSNSTTSEAVDGDRNTHWTPDAGETAASFNAAFDEPSVLFRFDLYVASSTSLHATSVKVHLFGPDVKWVVFINESCTDSFYHWNEANELTQCIEFNNSANFNVEIPHHTFWVFNVTNDELLWWKNFTSATVSVDGIIPGFSVAELEIYVIHSSVRRSSCNCNPIGLKDIGVSSPCNDDGTCRCRETNSSVISNSDCSPVITSPPTGYHGPQKSGGTIVAFQGSFLGQPASLDIGNRYKCDFVRNRSSDNALVLAAPPARLSDIGISMPYNICWVTETQDAKFCLITRDEFTYRPEPRLANISRTKSIMRGGLSVTINITNLDSIYGYFDDPVYPVDFWFPGLYPTVRTYADDDELRIQTFYDHDSSGNLRKCVVKSRTELVCNTPPINLHDNQEKDIQSHIREYVQFLIGNGYNATVQLQNAFEYKLDPKFEVWEEEPKLFRTYKGEEMLRIYVSRR